MNIYLYEDFKIVGGQEIYSVKLLEFLINLDHISKVQYFTSNIGINYIKKTNKDLLKYSNIFPKSIFQLIFFIYEEITKQDLVNNNLFIINSFRTAAIFSFLKLLFFKKNNIEIIFITHLSLNQFSKKISFTKNFIYKILDNLISMKCKRICISKELYEQYKKNSLNVSIIENCLSEENSFIDFKKQKSYTSEIGFVGRLDEQKGISYLSKLIKLTSKEKFISKIEIAGTGVLINNVNDLINYSSKVYYYGFLDSPFTVIKSKIFLMPSTYEGFPLTILELVNSGLVPLTSNIIAFKNILPDNYPMLKFNLDDDIKLIKYILLNQEYRLDMYDRISTHFKSNYSFNSWKNNWLKILDNK